MLLTNVDFTKNFALAATTAKAIDGAKSLLGLFLSLMLLSSLLSRWEIETSRAVFPDLVVRGLAASAQAIRPGEVFFAIRGTRDDGHKYLAEAASRGAILAVVEDVAAVPVGLAFVQVPSARRALAFAAAAFHGDPSHKLSLVAVTGTNGKTTTTFLLAQAWEALQRRAALLGTVEARIGSKVRPSALTTPDPLTLQAFFADAVKEGATELAFEASSIALDQFRADGSRVEYAVFTNLTQDHLDYHGTMERYFESKRRLFQGPTEGLGDTTPNAVINVDDPWGLRLLAEIPSAVSFSALGNDAHVRAVSFRQDRDGLEAELEVFGERAGLRSPLLGAHNLANLLGALPVLMGRGVSLDDAVMALGQCVGAPGRLERVALGGESPSVFVDYAHTDDALRRVLESLRPIAAQTGGRLVTVFGCGGDRDAGKRPKMGLAAATLSDVVVVTSDNPRTENPESIIEAIAGGIPAGTSYHREPDRRKAIALALEIARPEDLILIAGKGHETYQIVGQETRPFDDRAVVRACYSHSNN